MQNTLTRVLFFCALSAPLISCQSDSLADIKFSLAEVQATSAQTNEFIETQETKLKALPPGPERDAVLEQIAKAKSIKAQADTALDELQDKLNRIGEDGNEWDAAEATVDTVAKYLPPPFNIAGILAAGLFGVLAESRRRKTKNAAISIIDAIETAKGEDGNVSFNDPVTEATLRSAMSTDARKLVKKATR